MKSTRRGVTVTWSGFADLAFTESARLAFARAAELAETDAHEEHPEAWVIDDRRIVFSAESAASSLGHVAGMKRFLGLLALQAMAGDAVIEVLVPPERWHRHAALSSLPDDGQVSFLSDPPESRTLRPESEGRLAAGADELEEPQALKA